MVSPRDSGFSDLRLVLIIVLFVPDCLRTKDSFYVRAVCCFTWKLLQGVRGVGVDSGALLGFEPRL